MSTGKNRISEHATKVKGAKLLMISAPLIKKSYRNNFISRFPKFLKENDQKPSLYFCRTQNIKQNEHARFKENVIF